MPVSSDNWDGVENLVSDIIFAPLRDLTSKEKREVKRLVKESFKDLTFMQTYILIRFYTLDGGRYLSTNEIGFPIHRGGSNVSQKKTAAMNKLRTLLYEKLLKFEKGYE